jgi:hypothetical protein
MVACRARPGLQELRGVIVGRGMARSLWRHAALVGLFVAKVRRLVRVCNLYLFSNSGRKTLPVLQHQNIFVSEFLSVQVIACVSAGVG